MKALLAYLSLMQDRVEPGSFSCMVRSLAFGVIRKPLLGLKLSKFCNAETQAIRIFYEDATFRKCYTLVPHILYIFAFYTNNLSQVSHVATPLPTAQRYATKTAHFVTELLCSGFRHTGFCFNMIVA